MLSNSYQNWSLFCYFWFCGTCISVSYLCIMSCHGTRGLLKWQPGNPDTCAECYWGSLLWVVATWYGRILKSTPVSNPKNIIIVLRSAPARHQQYSHTYKVIYNTTLKRFQASCNVWISTHQLHLDSRSWHWWKCLEDFSFCILLFGFYILLGLFFF